MRWLHKFLTLVLCFVAAPSWAQNIQQTTLTADETILAGQILELDGTNINLADSAADVVVGVAALGATSGQQLLIRSNGIVTCPCEVGAAAGEYLSPGAVAGSGDAGSAAPTTTSFGYILGGRDGSGNCRILFGRFITNAGAITSLNDLSDVVITGPLTTNDGLVYDGANYVDDPIDFNQLANTDIASLTTGDIYFVNGAGNITRLPIGSSGEELTVSAGLPSWGISGSGGSVVISVEKATAGTINAGELVHIVSNAAGVIEVELAKADAAGTMPAVGITVDTVTDSTAGNVVVIGTENNLDTSTFTVGDIVYVSAAVAGALTDTKPTGTNLIQNMGVVSRSHATFGQVNIGAGRTNDLPNLPTDQLWVGDGSAVPVAVATLKHEAGGLEVDASLFSGIPTISGGVTTDTQSFTTLGTVLTGTLIHEDGGLEVDASAFAGLVRIDSGTTTDVTNLTGLNTAVGTTLADMAGAALDGQAIILFTTEAVTEGVTTVDLTFPTTSINSVAYKPKVMSIISFEVIPTDPGSADVTDVDVTIYSDDADTVTIEQWNAWDPSGGTLTDKAPLFYRDTDASNELHIKIDEQDGTTSYTYTITVSAIVSHWTS